LLSRSNSTRRALTAPSLLTVPVTVGSVAVKLPGSPLPWSRVKDDTTGAWFTLSTSVNPSEVHWP